MTWRRRRSASSSSSPWYRHEKTSRKSPIGAHSTRYPTHITLNSFKVLNNKEVWYRSFSVCKTYYRTTMTNPSRGHQRAGHILPSDEHKLLVLTLLNDPLHRQSKCYSCFTNQKTKAGKKNLRIHGASLVQCPGTRRRLFKTAEIPPALQVGCPRNT